MIEVTLLLNKTQYTVDSELLINHSQFLKDLIELFPDKKEYYIPFPIRSLDKFVDYVNGVSNTIPLDYEEFVVHKFLDTKNYFDHLIYLMVEQGPDHEKIQSLDSNLSWEIYDHLPLNLIPEEMLTEEFIERYRTKLLPKYPKNVIITRNERKIKTEVSISRSYYKDGIYHTWDENCGEEVFYHSYRKDGPYRSWDEKGRKEESSNWSIGKKDGLFESWYENGQKKEESNWLHGKKHGLHQTWYSDGKNYERTNWSEGKKDGLYESWYENGGKDEVSNWSEGEIHGSFETWYRNGQRHGITIWLHGKKHGSSQVWHQNGQMFEQSKWHEGKKIGFHQTWNQDGKKNMACFM